MCLARLLLVAAVLVLVVAATGPTANAGEGSSGPTYLILRGPAPAHNSPVLHGLPAQPYAYGWFGAQPRYRFRSKHYGYYGNYTQWTYR